MRLLAVGLVAALTLLFAPPPPVDDDDPIRRAVAFADPLGAVLGAGLDTTDVGALADAVRSGPTWVAGQTALYLGLRREGAAADAMLERLGRADAAGSDVALVADLLYGLYLVAAPDARAAAAAVADSLSRGLYPSGGTVSSMAYGAALDVLLALGDLSQLGVVADSARAGCAACAFYLEEIVAADSTRYPVAERALLAALDAGRLTVTEVLTPGTLQNTAAVNAAMFRVLDSPDRSPEHLAAIFMLGERPYRPERPLRGEALAARLETALLADTSGGRHRERFEDLDIALGVPVDDYYTRVLKGAVGFRHPLTIRLVERAAAGAYGPSIATSARDVLAERRLDRAPTCGGREATVFVSPGHLVRGGPRDGQPYADDLQGTAGPDVLVGTDGPDRIDGLGGGDVLCGLGGDDTLRGGDGTDTALGGDGDDLCDAETADCERDAFDLPAPVVAWGGSASFAGTAFAISGAAHALDGAPADGPGVAALVAPTDDALQAVLSALSARQRARLDGPAEARPLVFSPASWAEALAARATVTLGDRPGSAGSRDAPVVAYAPDSVRLDGRFEGVGVLVADGPVVLRGTARWTGLIVARDGLDVSGSASIVGGATVGGALAMGGRAQILYSPAALALARDAALALE